MRYMKLAMSFLEFLVKSITYLGFSFLIRSTNLAASLNDVELYYLLENARVFQFYPLNF